MPMPCLEIMFWKRALQKYVHIHAHTQMPKHNLDQNTIFDLGIGIERSFSGMALNVFWKRALQTLKVNLVTHVTVVTPIGQLKHVL